MVDINDYKLIYQLKIKSITRKWLFVLLIIIIGIIIITKSFKYEKYYSNIGEYKNNYIIMYVRTNDIKEITKNYRIKIKNNEFAYKIKSISEENIYIGNEYYKEVKLSVKKIKLKENEVIDINIIIDEYSILEYVFKTVWR